MTGEDWDEFFSEAEAEAALEAEKRERKKDPCNSVSSLDTKRAAVASGTHRRIKYPDWVKEKYELEDLLIDMVEALDKQR